MKVTIFCILSAFIVVNNLVGMFSGLHYAAANDDPRNIVRILATRGPRENVVASCNDLDEEGRTALHIAALLGSKPTVLLLLANGANVHARDNKKNTPLHYAVQSGRLENAMALLVHHADANVVNGDFFTPLHIAAGEGYSHIVDVLAPITQDINGRSRDGFTPLDMVVQKPYAFERHWRTWLDEKDLRRVCCLLLRHGAKLNVNIMQTYAIERLIARSR